MSLNRFISEVLPAKPYADYNNEETYPIRRRVHQNPLAVRVSIVALGSLGLFCFHQGVKQMNQFNFSWIIAGMSLLSISILAYKTLEIIAPLSHDPLKCTIETGTTAHGSVHYEKNTPVLTIKTKVPYLAGYAHGRLLAEPIYQLRKANSIAMHIFSRTPRHTEIPKTIKAIEKRLPSNVLEEIKGLVAGYNGKRKEWLLFKGSELTKEEVIFLHLLADKAHLHFRQTEKWIKRKWPTPPDLPYGCTVIIDGNHKSGPVFGRNLDWPSLGLLGSYTILIRRTSESGIRTVELGYPSLLGTITGMNEHGLCLAMNVCRRRTDRINGLPTVFYNRQCLGSSKSVSDVVAFTKRVKPLGPYHLSVADADEGKSIHFYQDVADIYYRVWPKSAPLVTTNYNYSRLGKYSPLTNSSQKREDILLKFFCDLRNNCKREKEDPVQWMHKALNLPHVNSLRTIHRVIFHPKTKRLFISYDNGWAGSKQTVEHNVN